MRWVGVGGMCMVLVASCSAESDISTTTTREVTTSTTLSAASSISSTTTKSEIPVRTEYVDPNRCLRPDEPQRLRISYGPVDGQYFGSLETVWTNGSVCPEAVVTVAGIEAEMRVGDRVGAMPYWRAELTLAEDCTGIDACLTGGTEPTRIVYRAEFPDGTSITQVRRFLIDPNLETFSGWIVQLHDDPPSITLGAATYEPGEDDGTNIGPITSVETYPVRDDAAFILLQPDNLPPRRVLTYDEFYLMMNSIEAGCPPGSAQAQLMSTPPSTDYNGYYECFFAAWPSHGMTSSADTPGHPFTISITPDGEIRQLKQQFTP